MFAYKGFTEDVLNVFSRVIDRYQFKILHRDDLSIRIGNRFWWINFDMDRMDLQVHLIDPGNPNEEFGFTGVLNYLFPKIIIKINSKFKTQTKEFVQDQLRYYEKLMSDHMQKVLDGDYTWKPGYREYLFHQKQLIAKLWALDYNDPIYQKFRKGDATWQEDLRKL